MGDQEKKVILVVDDDEASRYATVRIIRSAGFEVVEAATGHKALERAKDIDLIILDLNLPDISGFEVCKRLKSDPATKSIPVIHLTATYCSIRDKVAGLEGGADGYLTSPVEPEELLASIRALLRLRKAEQQMEREARQWTATFDAINDSISLLDPDGRILRCNRAFGEMVGGSGKQISLRFCYEIFHGMHAFIEGCPFLKAREIGKRATADLKRGEQWLSVTVDPTRDANGRVISFVHVMRDITERKQAEVELQHSEMQYRTLAENSPDLIARFDRQLRHLYVNSTAAKAGPRYTTPEGYVGKTIIEAGVSEREARKWEERIRTVFETGQIVDVEDAFETPNGLKHYSTKFIPEFAPDGSIHSVQSIARDITERKRAEAERELLMAAIEQAGEIVLITDAEGTIQYANPAFETATGYSREEALGQNPRMLKSGEQGEAFYQELWQTISSGKSWQGTLVNKRKDGTLYSEESTISPVCDAGGRIVSYVAVKRDITAQRLMEEQLRQAQKMETVGQLAGGVAHDFNNMLQVIISYVEMSLAKVDAGQPLHKYLLEIRRAGQRSAEITGQLLAFARKQTVSPKVVDLNDAVAGSQKMIQRLIGEDIDLAWMPGHDLWKVKIDPAQLDQILANLAVNARDAIGGVGKLTVETRNVTLDEAYCATHAGSVPGEYVLLAVSDDGKGMDKQTMGHLFEPFFTTKGQGKGTGLGLATIYGIVKQNNGFINVYSEPGEGSTFKVYLPRAEWAEAAERMEAEAGAPRGGTETVLVAEDEAAILELAKESLEQLGYTVLVARSPEEALRKAEERAGPIDLLITDVVMPQMNGRQLCERLRAARSGLKCLYMSGYTANVIAHRGVLEEGVSFMAKPFSLTTLAEKVREVLDG